tara:strand:+ start:78 stop:1265 length:1188 start_codon:yes stop_codon:yes gene_type:complete
MNAHPLMSENIDRGDIDQVVEFLQQDPIPRLTNGPKVEEFEAAWSRWLGVKHSVFVNSGTGANYMTMHLLRYLHGSCDIIVPPLTWVSDVASVINNGHTPIFVDINLCNLSFDINKLRAAITPNTKAIFLTHVLGLNGVTDELLSLCAEKNILLIEDVCESHGATYRDEKAGTIGQLSNFSFYFAHHMSTIEGGMVCTNNDEYHDLLRAFRSHGMVRECKRNSFKECVKHAHPDLNPDFIFLSPAYNMRSSEINAVLGLSQIKKLDDNNKKRQDNFNYFLSKLDSDKYMTDFNSAGQCNYALIVMLNPGASITERDNIEALLDRHLIEHRRGLSGGGNQLRQPYIEKYGLNKTEDQLKADFANVEHVHNYSWYVGNYPTLKKQKIDTLVNLLNNV